MTIMIMMMLITSDSYVGHVVVCYIGGNYIGACISNGPYRCCLVCDVARIIDYYVHAISTQQHPPHANFVACC